MRPLRCSIRLGFTTGYEGMKWFPCSAAVGTFLSALDSA